MTTIDYEAEYDNRGRVADSAGIMARWAKEAAAYRTAMTDVGRAELDVAYGDTPRQIMDIYYPWQRAKAPLAVFIHGGYWRALAPATFGHLAEGMTSRGATLAMIGYDLTPAVGIADIIEQTRRALLMLWRRFKQPILVSGHSAGGHLTACMVATDWRKLAPDAGNLVTAGYAISGLFDLEPLRHTTMNADFKLDKMTAHKLSPLFWSVPPKRSLDAVVGGDESDEFIRQSRTVAEAWGNAGTSARCDVIPGKNHFTIIEALADPHSAMVNRMMDLAR